MSERSLTVYSVEGRDFLEQSGFLLKLDFGFFINQILQYFTVINSLLFILVASYIIC